MKTRKTNRLLAVILCLCMVFGTLPMTGMTLAAGAQTCYNHAAHDDTCGFVQAVEGQDCDHAHDDTCGYAEATEGQPCQHEQGKHDESCGYTSSTDEIACGHTHDESCGEPDENGEYPNCAHEHDGGCGYAPAGEGAPCAHQEHDGDCGYVEAVTGAACQHEHNAACGYIEAVKGSACGHIHTESCEGITVGSSDEESSLSVEESASSDTLLKTMPGRASFPLWGVVQTQDGANIVGIRVSLWKDGLLIAEVKTNDTGYYSFYPDSGSYIVKVGGWADDGIYYAEQSQSFTVANVEPDRIHFKLVSGDTSTARYAVNGTVRDKDGKEFENIPVQLLYQKFLRYEATTGSDGSYAFPQVEEGSYTLKIPGGTYMGTTYSEITKDIAVSGENMTLDSITLVPGALVPGAPRNFTANPGDKQVSLSWDTPASDGGAEITKYQVSKDNGENWEDVIGKTDFTFSGLTNGTEYTFQVRAVNSVGESEAVVAAARPVAPGTYSISGKVDSASGYHYLEGIDVTLWKDGQQVGAVKADGGGHYSFISLAPGEYTVKTGGWLGGVYYIEQSQTVTITNGNVSCRFKLEPGNAPGTYSISGRVHDDDSPNPLTGIGVTLWQDGQQVGAVNTDRYGNYSFTSLSPGEYTVKASGWSGGVYYTEQSKTVTITNGDQSCNFNLEPGNAPGTYSISGRVTSLDVLSSISGMPVELWQNGERIGSTETVVSGDPFYPETKFLFSSIAPGTYTLRVPAGVYGGTYYLESTNTLTLENFDITSIVFQLQPGTAPAGYVVSGKIQNATGGGLQGVTVQLLNSNVKMFETTTGADGSFSFPKVSDAAYTLKILAGTYGGTVYREATEAITVSGQNLSVGAVKLSAATAPTAPQSFKATPGIGQVVLSWTVPQSNGGVDITKYEVSKDGGASWENASSATGHTFTGLTGGQIYTFQVRAVNGVGAGAAAEATATPTAPGPSAPQNLYAQYGNQTLYLHWKAPANNGGAAIVKYQYSATADGSDDWKDIPGSGPDTVTYTVTGLTNGTTYTLKVRAVNSNGGVGEAASTTLAPGAVAPSVPRNLTATPGDGQMTLDWEVPESDGGLPITHYQYRYNVDPDSVGGPDGWTRMPDSGPDTVSFTVTGLENGKELAFFVRAWNSYSASTAAMVMGTPQAAATAPTAPQSFKATPGIGQVELTWTAPSSNGGVDITKYEVSKDGGASWTDASSTTGHTFTGLTGGQIYTFQVRAVNGVGAGAAATTTATPQAETPATFTLTVSNGTDVTASGPYDEGAKVNIRANVPADGKLFKQWTSSGGGSFDDANSPETTFTMPAGNVTVTATYEDDQTAPTGTITVKNNGWTEFLNSITFGVFFKETQQVSITAKDNSDQDVAIAYHMADAALTLEQVKALADSAWTAYTGAFSIAPNARLVVYARLTDKAGNATYISSNGIVLDNAAPSFSLEDGKTYDSAQTLTVTDNYALASVKLGEAEQLSPDFTGTETQIALNVNGAYTIEATDKAGNAASITVTIYIPVVTAPNLTGITAPTAITGVANGTPLADISLPDKVVITTTQGDKQAGVTWNRNVPAYNPDSETAQTFTISGNVTLPDGVTNTNGVSLTVTISVTVEAKGAVTVTGLEIASNPNQTAYTEGEALDLTGLSVKLTFSDGSDKTVALADFAANNITATPANGAKLSLSNTTVTVSTGGKSAGFPITVNAMQQVETPVFTPAGGAYGAAQEVEIACGTPGAKIHYTTDGRAPTAASPLYTGKIPVGSTTTIKAVAIKDGMKNSAVATAAYTINTTPPPVITVPGAPRSFKATPGDKRVILSWTPPQSNGGAEITKYEVSKDNGANWENASSATGHTFTGLTNDTSYIFQVRAVNSKGAGAEASATATPSATVYRLTVTNGRDMTNSGPYAEGAQVRIQADAATSGWTFDKWEGGADSIFVSGSRTSSTTTITMPAGDVEVKATYKRIDNGGGSSNNGGSSSGGGGSSSGSGSANGSAIGTPKNNYTVTGDKISQTVSRTDLKKLADDRKSLTLNSGEARMTFDPAALKAILAAVPATAGNITFAAAPADISAFPEAAKLIGNRPVYNYTISYKDSKGNTVNVNANFPAGSVSISMNYPPAEGEVTGNLFMVYVDSKGAVTWLDKSSYSSGKVLADVPHFSIYGVAYKAPATVFTDITGHWAKADMEFVAARGLLSGTGEKVFSPDTAMTRGMFVTALGRLAGVNPASYQTRSFTDVKTDAYYAAYVEWAVQKNIVKGIGEGLFSPDAPVTREQMAVMMTNYAGQMGYSIPTPLAAVTFADNDRISTWAAKEVAAMQRAGIIKGKDGNRFDPQASATRAEVSAVLRRFVEIVIDPVTAQGWVKNDSGQWLYYKDGKALTGWKQLGGKWYYFDKNGIMAVNTKVDGYEIGPDGARKEE